MLEHILFHSSCHWISSSKMELEGIRLRLEKKKKKAKGFLSTFKVSWQPSFILLEPKKKKSISFEDLCPCSVCSLRICIAVVSRLEDIGKEKKAPVIHHGPFIV